MLIPSDQFYTPHNTLNNSDFEKEYEYYFKYEKKEIESEISELSLEEGEKSKVKYKNKKQVRKGINKMKNPILYRKRLRGKEEDIGKVYNEIMEFIKEKTSLNKEIINKLGNLYLIDSTEQEVNFNIDYAFIFYIDQDTFKLDKNKKIGLILKNNGVSYNIDLKANIVYNSYNELIKNFPNNFLFGIGTKK